MRPADFGHATDTGKVRDHNEDHYCADPGKGFWMVADGMGGYDGGEVASAVAVEAVKEAVYRGRLIESAIADAHHAVTAAAANGEGFQGMGSTAVALKIDGLCYTVAWVGDSRAYLWNGELTQLTRDHSYVQRLIEAGALDASDARSHPQRNVITQALGAEGIKEVTPGSVSGTLYRGQKILLCSDGLTGELEDGQIAGIIAAEGTDQQRVDRLIRAANDSGGEDNITAILVSAPAEAPFQPRKGNTGPMCAEGVNRKIRRRQRLRFILFLLAAAALGLGVLLFAHFRQPPESPPALSLPAAPASMAGHPYALACRKSMPPLQRYGIHHGGAHSYFEWPFNGYLFSRRV